MQENRSFQDLALRTIMDHPDRVDGLR